MNEVSVFDQQTIVRGGSMKRTPATNLHHSINDCVPHSFPGRKQEPDNQEHLVPKMFSGLSERIGADAQKIDVIFVVRVE